MIDLTQLKHYPWKRIGLIILCAVLSVTFIAMIFVTAFIESALGKINRPGENNTFPPNLESIFTRPTLPPDFTGETVDPSNVTLPPSPTDIIQHKDLVNIMLVGQDRRPNEHYRTRSDAMILMSFNKRTGTITMTSFMRDLYVTIPGRSPDKMNAAYAYGGMPLLADTMLENFGVKVDAFLEVDFAGFEKVVNTIGGVDILLTQQEASYMNKELGTGLIAGMNHLDGPTALFYSRIRVIGTDFARTQRQRNVINAVLASCRYLSLGQIMDMANQVLPMITTDMTNSQITGYIMDLFPMLAGSSIVSQRVPIDGSYTLTYVGAMDVVLADLAVNHRFLYNTLMP